MEMHHFGSGIWSQMRFSTGAIFSVTVPATIMRSDCRGLGRNTSAPKRAMSKRDVLKFEGCGEAWRRALASAGLALSDLSFVETHDCFTIAELIEYEAMGLTAEGEGARAIKEGWTQKDGKLPINPSGGLKAKGHPPGFALGNAVGDGNGFASWLLWSHNASLLDEEGNVIINSKETIAALKYLKELYPTFIAGTPSWNDVSNNRAYSSGEIALTANGVSLYFSLKKDPATAAIAEDTEHQLLIKGLAPVSPMSGLTLNAMVFKHSPYPNAAKAFLQFMLEKEQYEPWLNANSGYWAQPLAAYADAAVWSGDPKVAIFKDTMKSNYYNGYKGPISTATGAVNADYVLVQMCASVATDAATPEAAAAEAERRAKRYFRRS